jgi:DNA polymerase III epsilon subunit-like protein
MTKLMGIDLESTGWGTSLQVIETGAVSYSTHHNQPLEMYSELAYTIDGTIQPEVRDLTGIKDDMLGDGQVFYTGKENDILANLINHILKADPDFLVAHNAFGFEKPILETKAEEIEIDFTYNWIDTMVDIQYLPHKTSAGKSLTGLCATHDILNPYPHRALPDTLVMLKLLGKYQDDFPLIEQVASTPMLWIRAGVDKRNKDLAKDAGFMWDFVNYCWVKQMREYWLSRSSFPFTAYIQPPDYRFREPPERG